MRLQTFWLPALVLLAGCAADTGGLAPEAPVYGGKGDVWGSDDRTETRDGSRAIRELASAGAMLLVDGYLDEVTDSSGARTGYELDPLLTENLRTRYRTCDDVRFSDQPSVGFCSGTLVAPDLVLTAGHCIARTGGTAERARCADVAYVFGFAYDGGGGVVGEFDDDDVYRCARVEHLRNEEYPNNLDWALVRLDRPVRGRDPVPVLRGTPQPGTQVMQIAHPSGLPQKLSPGVVTDELDFSALHEQVSFTYDSDLLGGASGGGVFVTSMGAVAGVPAAYSGQNYVPNATSTCNVVGVCGVNTTCDVPPTACATATMIRHLEVEAPALLAELTVVGDAGPVVGSCRFPCDAHYYSEGECANEWQCVGGCLTHNFCTESTEPPPCAKPCSQYLFREGQCYGGWRCTAGCLEEATCS